MFTIGLISDAHLGYTSGKKKVDENGYNIRENDGYEAMKKAVDQMIEEKVDCCIIPGDIFHSPRPKNHTIIIAQECLRKLSAAGIPVYLIAGNHDATDVRMEIPSSRILHEPNGNIYSYCEPYVVNEIAPNIYAHFVSHHAYTEQDTTMDQIELIKDAINILVSHGSCFDTNIGMMLHSPSEPREVIIPQHIMDLPWDYTFLGHIHERGWVASTDKMTDTANRKQFYGGSLIRRGFSDKQCPLGRGWTKWILDEKEFTPEFFTIEERPQFDMKPIKAKDKSYKDIEKELLEQIKAIYNYIKKNYGDFTPENIPIVRQTIIGISPSNNLLINWKKINRYTATFLTYTSKVVKEGDIINSEGTISVEALNSGDIVAVFKEWNKDVKLDIEETMKDEVVNSAETFLKLSRDKELNNN